MFQQIIDEVDVGVKSKPYFLDLGGSWVGQRSNSPHLHFQGYLSSIAQPTYHAARSSATFLVVMPSGPGHPHQQTQLSCVAQAWCGAHSPTHSPSAAAGSGQNQLSCSHVLRPALLPAAADKGRVGTGSFPHPHYHTADSVGQGQLSCSTALRANSLAAQAGCMALSPECCRQ